MTKELSKKLRTTLPDALYKQLAHMAVEEDTTVNALLIRGAVLVLDTACPIAPGPTPDDGEDEIPFVDLGAPAPQELPKTKLSTDEVLRAAGLTI
jgi:hypothetical protein